MLDCCFVVAEVLGILGITTATAVAAIESLRSRQHYFTTARILGNPQTVAGNLNILVPQETEH